MPVSAQVFWHPSTGRWEQVPILEEITKSLPQIDDDTQRSSTVLAGEAVNDIQGNGGAGYQTLKDGWIFQEIVDAVRAGNGWFEVPEEA